MIYVVGGGLVGSLLSLTLARRGLESTLIERRPDIRKHKIAAGRSVNLALSLRGIEALKRVGMDEAMLKLAIPMLGRRIHPVGPAGTPTLFLPYGKDDSYYINSISRGGLNQALLDACERSGRVKMIFDRKVESRSEFDNHAVIFGTDGSASSIRDELERSQKVKVSPSVLPHSYKELTLYPRTEFKDGETTPFRLEKNALHIWPRQSFMLIALPNLDGSFTCTLFLATHAKQDSFDQLTTPETLNAFFKKYFPDMHEMMPNLNEDFFENPTGHMTTIKATPWHSGGNVMLIGDAAHAIVPFFGQGMNCGFEDVSALDDLMDAHGTDWKTIFPKLTEARKPNGDAIADLAVENFTEMRDKVADPTFQLERKIEKLLEREYPGRYVSRYGLVTFCRVPYQVALQAGVIEADILKTLANGISEPESFDRNLASELIGQRLDPILAPYAAILPR